MEPEENDASNEYNPLRLDQVASSIDHMETLLEDLSARMSVLPDVDEKGRSECPFAEDLYAKKEEAEEKVARELGQLRRYPGLVNEEMSRCRKNLEQLRSDGGRLNRDETKEHYSFAEGSQEAHYRMADQLYQKLIDLIPRAEEALRLAGTKRFPGIKPQKSVSVSKPPGSDRFTPMAPRPVSSQAMGPSLGKEIDSLMSIGPLGKTTV